MTKVFQQLIVGLRHLHACGVLHRDLKSDNVMVASTAPLLLKWGDFGVSVLLLAPTEYGEGAWQCRAMCTRGCVSVADVTFSCWTRYRCNRVSTLPR